MGAMVSGCYVEWVLWWVRVIVSGYYVEWCYRDGVNVYAELCFGEWVL